MTNTTSTVEYFADPAREQLNGNKPQPELVDNRLQLLVDGRQVETWELMVMESRVVSDWILIFARYLARGDRLVSPDLPREPIDELTRADKARILNSDAYKMLKRMSLPNLKRAAESFLAEAASLGTDPN